MNDPAGLSPSANAGRNTAIEPGEDHDRSGPAHAAAPGEGAWTNDMRWRRR